MSGRSSIEDNKLELHVAFNTPLKSVNIRIKTIVLLYKLRETHSLINTRNCTQNFREEALCGFIAFDSAEIRKLDLFRVDSWVDFLSSITNLENLLMYIEYHSEKIIEALYCSWFFPKLLIKSITKVVRWICRDNQNLFRLS